MLHWLHSRELVLLLDLFAWFLGSIYKLSSIVSLVEKVIICWLACVAPVAEIILILSGRRFFTSWQVEAHMLLMNLGLDQRHATTMRVRTIRAIFDLRNATALCIE